MYLRLIMSLVNSTARCSRWVHVLYPLPSSQHLEVYRQSLSIEYQDIDGEKIRLNQKISSPLDRRSMTWSFDIGSSLILSVVAIYCSYCRSDLLRQIGLISCCCCANRRQRPLPIFDVSILFNPSPDFPPLNFYFRLTLTIGRWLIRQSTLAQ